MSFKRILICGCLAALMSTGCASDPGRTHDSGLLDDKVTAQRVYAALQRGGAEFRSVKVEALKGVVTLSGTVPTEQHRERAEALAKSQERVSKVDDRLEVRR